MGQNLQTLKKGPKITVAIDNPNNLEEHKSGGIYTDLKLGERVHFTVQKPDPESWTEIVTALWEKSKPFVLGFGNSKKVYLVKDDEKERFFVLKIPCTDDDLENAKEAIKLATEFNDEVIGGPRPVVKFINPSVGRVVHSSDTNAISITEKPCLIEPLLAGEFTKFLHMMEEKKVTARKETARNEKVPGGELTMKPTTKEGDKTAKKEDDKTATKEADKTTTKDTNNANNTKEKVDEKKEDKKDDKEKKEEDKSKKDDTSKKKDEAKKEKIEENYPVLDAFFHFCVYKSTGVTGLLHGDSKVICNLEGVQGDVMLEQTKEVIEENIGKGLQSEYREETKMFKQYYYHLTDPRFLSEWNQKLFETHHPNCTEVCESFGRARGITGLYLDGCYTLSGCGSAAHQRTLPCATIVPCFATSMEKPTHRESVVTVDPKRTLADKVLPENLHFWKENNRRGMGH